MATLQVAPLLPLVIETILLSMQPSGSRRRISFNKVIVPNPPTAL